MKKMKKVLLLVLCAALLVGATIAGTVAYLTSKTEVVNTTFTAGNVKITLQEYVVDPQTGVKDMTKTPVTKLENLEMVPGRVIQKNPFITVDSNSESCYLFVKIVNGLGEAVTIDGMEDWVSLGNGYYRYKAVVNAGAKIDVFTSVTCAATGVDFGAIAEKSISITAYAVQSEGVTEDVAYTTVKDLG